MAREVVWQTNLLCTADTDVAHQCLLKGSGSNAVTTIGSTHPKKLSARGIAILERPEDHTLIEVLVVERATDSQECEDRSQVLSSNLSLVWCADNLENTLGEFICLIEV